MPVTIALLKTSHDGGNPEVTENPYSPLRMAPEATAIHQMVCGNTTLFKRLSRERRFMQHEVPRSSPRLRNPDCTSRLQPVYGLPELDGVG